MTRNSWLHDIIVLLVALFCSWGLVLNIQVAWALYLLVVGPVFFAYAARYPDHVQFLFPRPVLIAALVPFIVPVLQLFGGVAEYLPALGQNRRFVEGVIVPASVNPGMTIDSIIQWGGFVLTVGLGALLATRVSSRRRAMTLMALLGVLLALYALVTYRIGDVDTASATFDAQLGRLSGPFASANVFACFLGFTSLACLYMLRLTIGDVRSHFGRFGFGVDGLRRALGGEVIIAVGVSVLLVFAWLVELQAILQAGSRGALLATICATIALIVVPRMKRGQAASPQLVGIVARITLVTVLGLVLFSYIGRVADDRLSALMFWDPVRAEIWAISASMVGDRWMWGFGLGGFADAFSLYNQSMVLPRPALYAHSGILNIVVGVGAIGTSAILVALVMVLRGRRRFFRTYASNVNRHSPLLVGLCIFAVVYGVVDDPFRVPSTMFVWGFLAGLCLGAPIRLRTK